jgi:hypothetical protein
MSIARSLGVLAAGGLFKLGVESAGRSLVETVGTPDEQSSTLAGMMLVQVGPRSAPLVIEALHRGQKTPALATILGDLGGPDAEAELIRLVQAGDGPLVEAARRSLSDLEQIRRMGEPEAQ